MNLERSASGRRLPFDIDAVWYGPDGSEFARQTLNTYMDAAWKNSLYTIGWGSTMVPNWQPGCYTLELYIDGKMIAQGPFEIY